MAKLHSVPVNTNHGTKEIAVYHDSATLFEEPIDILTTSAYVGCYEPTPGTLFFALQTCGISVNALAQYPALDLRKLCNVWLSDPITKSTTDIHRIGCIELLGRDVFGKTAIEVEQAMITSIRAYFSMLDTAALYDVKMDTVALPLLGSGRQGISPRMLLIPLLNECIAFLKRNVHVKRLYFIEKNEQKAQLIAAAMQSSYRFIEQVQETPAPPVRPKCAFISYASEDKNIADNLCAKLESKGVPVWYAPRDVRGPYAEAIAKAIDSATIFVVILSQNSIASEHVLNEIDLAFQNLPSNIIFMPLRIDDAVFTPSFKYYLSRQHWLDATIPPLEERLNEFVQDLLERTK